MEFLVLVALFVGAYLFLKNKKRKSDDDMRVTDGAATWEKGFIVFFILDKLQREREYQNATQFLANLSRKEISFSDNQTLLVLLKSYLHKIGASPLTPETYQKIVNLLPSSINWELAAFDSKASLRNYLSSLVEDGGEQEGMEDLNKRTEEFLSEIKGNKEHLEAVKLELIKFRLNSSFVKYHSVSFEEFHHNIIDDYVDNKAPTNNTL